MQQNGTQFRYALVVYRYLIMSPHLARVHATNQDLNIIGARRDTRRRASIEQVKGGFLPYWC